MRILLIAGAASLLAAGSAPAQLSPFAELNEQVERIAEQSPTFSRAIASVPEGRILLTYGTLPGRLAGATQYEEGGRASVFLDSAKLADPELLVVTIVHELYGHAVPYASGGEVCADPRTKQRYRSSCVGKREGVIMEELGKARRTVYWLR